MTLGLSGNDDGVECPQLVDEFVVFSGDLTTFEVCRHLGAKNRVMLGRRVVPLDTKIRLAVTGDRVKENRFLECGDQRMARFRQASNGRAISESVVLPCLPAGVSRSAAGVAWRHQDQDSGCRQCPGLKIHFPSEMSSAETRVNGEGMFTAFIHEIDRMKDLHRLMRIHRRDNLGDARRDCDTGIHKAEGCPPLRHGPIVPQRTIRNQACRKCSAHPLPTTRSGTCPGLPASVDAARPTLELHGALLVRNAINAAR